MVRQRSRRMNCSPARSSPLMKATLLWAAVGCTNLLLLSLGPFDLAQAENVMGTTACGLLLSLAMALATSRLMAGGGRRATLLLAMLALAGGACLWALDTTLQGRLSGIGVARRPVLDAFVRLRLNLVYYELLFLLQASVLALLTLQTQAREREYQLAEQRMAAQQARLAALRLQLNPHFLFNTLNALSTLVGDGAMTAADEMIARLSAFLRAALDDDGAELTTLERELETTQAYLHIEAVRFGERMEVHYASEEDLAEALLPSLILQPLVENSVKHAVARNTAGAAVCITARRRNERLFVTVEDDGAARGARAAGSVNALGGLGLRNVAARLEALYGAGARLDAGPTAGGFRASIDLPLVLAREGSAG